MEIISRELGMSQLEITKNGGKSNMVVGYSKKSIEGSQNAKHFSGMASDDMPESRANGQNPVKEEA